MMEDLQQAYAAYQQALYHLTDPKVSALKNPRPGFGLWLAGTETMVWDWHSV